MEVDGRSVYVGNVDYGATAEELEQARLTSVQRFIQIIPM